LVAHPRKGQFNGRIHLRQFKEISSMSKFNSERRQFIRQTAWAAAAVALLPVLKFQRAFAADKPPLKESDPTAKALSYVEKAEKADKTKRVEKMGVAAKEQYCNNCMFFTSTSKTRGNCQIFPNGSVNAKGWCASWSKKAA